MTTFTSKPKANAFSRLSLFLGFILLSSGAFAQLDSVSVSNVSFTQELTTDSLNGSVDTLNIMNVEIYIDDIDFMGEVIVMVYDQTNGFPLQIVKHTKSELDNLGLITNATAKMEVAGLSPETNSYKIDVQVRDFYGGNLPVVSTLY